MKEPKKPTPKQKQLMRKERLYKKIKQEIWTDDAKKYFRYIPDQKLSENMVSYEIQLNGYEYIPLSEIDKQIISQIGRKVAEELDWQRYEAGLDLTTRADPNCGLVRRGVWRFWVAPAIKTDFTMEDN